jgi:hypothetical protein
MEKKKKKTKSKIVGRDIQKMLAECKKERIKMLTFIVIVV